jgi:hypothetical protein
MLDRVNTFLKEQTEAKGSLESVLNHPELMTSILNNEISQNNELFDLRVRIGDIFDPEMELIAQYNSDKIMSLRILGAFHNFESEDKTGVLGKKSLNKFVDSYGYLGLVDQKEYDRLIKSHPNGEQFSKDCQAIWKNLSKKIQNKKLSTENYFPVLFYLYQNVLNKKTPKIGDFLELQVVFPEEKIEDETSEMKEEISNLYESYHDLYNDKLIPSFHALSFKSVKIFDISSKQICKKGMLESATQHLKRFELEHNLQEIDSIDQLFHIVCSKIYFGVFDILNDQLSALMFLFALLSSKSHKLNNEYIDFISVNLFNVTCTQRNQLIQFLSKLNMRKLYVNISSKTKNVMTQASNEPNTKVTNSNSENINLENLPKKNNSSSKQSFSNLKTEQFTFDNLIGKKRLFAEKCNDSGVILQGNVIPKDSLSVIIIDETNLSSSKKFDQFTSKQLLGLQNVLSTNSLEWDFKFGTVITHDCSHKLIGLSSSLSIMKFGFKVHVGDQIKAKSLKKELKVIQEVEEGTEIKESKEKEIKEEKFKIDLNFLDETLVPLYKSEYLDLGLELFGSLIPFVEIPNKSKDYIQNHYIATRKEIKKGKGDIKEFQSKDLQNCIRIAKHITTCQLQENMIENDYVNSYKIYKEIKNRLIQYQSN